jgi:hypothetical protein
MKIIAALYFCLFVMIAVSAYADPRMEVNDTFNHVILETGNTDNEAFIANTDPNIIVQNGVAWGFVDNFAKNPKFKDVFPGDFTKFSSGEGGAPCTMVESNGTEYVSSDWTQLVRRHNNVIYYRLECRNGIKK